MNAKPEPPWSDERSGEERGPALGVPVGDELEHAEQQFVRQLGNVALEAVRAQRQLSLPIVFQRGQQIIKQYSDGTETVLTSIVPAQYTIPVGIPILEEN